MADPVGLPVRARSPALDRQAVLGVGIFLALLVVFLTQTRLPAVLSKLSTLDQGASAAGRATFSAVLDPLAFPEELRWIAYGVNLWDANAVGMFFAILLGGAAAALAPAALRTGRLAIRRGPAGATLGGVMGVPLFMCSACSAPVSLGFRRGGASVETTLGIVLGSALLNPVGIFAIFLLLPVELGLARVAFAAAMIAGVAPLAARLGPASSAPEGAPVAPPVDVRTAPATWTAAARAAIAAWWRAATDHALRLVPPMALASVGVGAVLVVLPPQALSDAFGAGVVAIAAAAAVGTLLQLPTLFEIPLVLGLVALGAGDGAAAALLLAAPSAGLVTFTLLRKELGARPPAVLMAATFAGALLAGVAVSAL